MRQVYSEKRKPFLHSFLLKLIPIVLVLIGMPMTGTASAMSSGKSQRLPLACPAVGAITSQSLLVVLLDRSGSLILQPGATDPNGYSTSVTKALADLWPGLMAVIPFSGDTTSLPVYGPATLSDPMQRADLKSKVESYRIGGDTPLGPAMHQALTLLQGAAPGSRIIIVTDGNPTGLGSNDGPHQEQDIRTNLISKFCNLGIPVSAFGLTIDPNTSDGQDATRLLTDITRGTDASYLNVTRPEDLARAVISLYAQWLGLSFIEEPVQGGNAPVAVDTSAKQVTILTFRSDSSTPVVLDGPDGQPTQGVQSSPDRHYIINALTSGSGVFVPGTYTIHTSNDQDVQVYALVNSTLQIQIVVPTAHQRLSYNTPVDIEAKFVDNGNDKQPGSGEAAMFAIVKLFVNGKQVRSTKIPLLQVQNSPIFKGQTTTYGQVGDLQIEVDGNDQGVQREARTSVQLMTPPVPPPPPCKLGFWGCLWQQVVSFYRQHQTLILTFTPILLFLLFLLFWVLRKGPRGSLSQARNVQDLGTMRRPFFRKLLHKSVMNSRELENYGDFRFDGAKFDLIFRGGARIRARSDAPPIKVRKGNQYEEVTPDNRYGVDLADQDSIYAGKCPPATFLEETGS